MGKVTGLILAGGRGSRMGGVDKGLQPFDGQPLVQHSLRRLAPQVDRILISANRNLEVYARLNAPVYADAQADFPGPLAGFLTGLTHCDTEWLATVPCDTPRFPTDLVRRLFDAVGHARAAVAVTRSDNVCRRQPVFCLLHHDLRASLSAYLQSGERKIERWLLGEHCVDVSFDDITAFANANTPGDLERLNPEREGRPPQ